MRMMNMTMVQITICHHILWHLANIFGAILLKRLQHTATGSQFEPRFWLYHRLLFMIYHYDFVMMSVDLPCCVAKRLIVIMEQRHYTKIIMVSVENVF